MAKFTEMPRKAQLGIVAVLGLVASVALYFVVYKSMSDENRANEVKLQAKIAENNTLRPYEQKLPELNRTVDALKLQLENLQKIVPDEKEADQFMHAMQNEARRAGIEVRRYEAKPTTTREFYTEVPFDMELDGPYYAMLNFFDRVSKLERIINISNLQVGAVKGGDVKGKKTYHYGPRESVISTCMATTFFSHETNQPAKPTGPARKK
ncbi:MAG TPA: type 4a pilus biogenesis protein PilO [Terriglobales bacterium]|nr:type 4a pilus biogenesis protein PilO [Terriglobales bacterium]